jgi:hypothetical protein
MDGAACKEMMERGGKVEGGCWGAWGFSFLWHPCCNKHKQRCAIQWREGGVNCVRVLIGGCAKGGDERHGVS